MAKVVNLNEFRKQKAKLEREKRADTNRRLHGRTKAERQRELLQKQRLLGKVDGARLEPSSKRSVEPEPERLEPSSKRSVEPEPEPRTRS